MSELALQRSRRVAAAITGALGGSGIFGVELFVQGDEVWFSEVSPRPHDTGLVTLVSQSLSEFALHVRAMLGLPIPLIRQWGPSASCALLVEGKSSRLRYEGADLALAEPDTELRLFGKPEVNGRRRMGVALARAATVDEARDTARRAAGSIVARL
jgi:phosphoribosylglycinamide formyltransferase 2